MASRGGAVPNPTTGIYTETNGDVIEICADAACTSHTTSFAPGDTVYLRVTTTRVFWAWASSSYLRLNDFQNNQVASSNWTRVNNNSPYVYTASLVIPNSVSGYLKVSGNVSIWWAAVQFDEQIHVSGLNQYLRFFSDPARSDESYTFAPGATVHVSAYGSGAAYSPGNTGAVNGLYDSTGTAAYNWNAPTVTQNGNWYDFSLTLPGAGLNDGDWYDLETGLLDASGATIESMPEMIQIDGSPPVAAVTSPAAGYVSGNVQVNGTATDAISFYKYGLEYGAGSAPSSWIPVGGEAYTPVTGGLLGNWDTTAVPDGLYTLRLTATDRAYNTGVATVQVRVDNHPPVISGIGASPVHSSSATVNWTTNEPAGSQVDYGTSPGSYPYSTTLDPAPVTSHSQTLTGLKPNTTYYYRVRSTDPAGNAAVSAESSFHTANITILQPYPALGRDTNYGTARPDWNRGAEEYLRAGDLASPDYGTMRSVLRFDLAGIPAGATVNSATMSLYQVAEGDHSTPVLDAHRLTADWKEGTGAGSATGDGATWNTSDGQSSWLTAGGGFDPVPGASAIAPDSTGAWVDWDITGLTQSWIDGTAPNYGVLVKRSVENPAGSDLKRFVSSDYAADGSLRPRLTIEWTGADTRAPNIGEVRSENITLTGADIKWSTDEDSSSQVEFGTTTSYGSTSPVDATLVNQHSVTLTGLAPDTLYHYRVISSDAAGNQATSGDFVFHTAAQLVIQPAAGTASDTTIFSSRPNLNYGISTFIRAGNNNAGIFRGALRFDLSAIPAGSVIQSATFSLYQYAQASTATPQLGVYGAARAWKQGTGNAQATGNGATWNTYDGVNNWTAWGGDFNPAAQATANAPNGTNIWVNFDVTALTQNWVNGSVANNGVFIKKVTESNTRDFKTYRSAEYNANPAQRPKLVVQYLPAPDTITMTVNATFNRDGSFGSGSVDFGNVSPGTTYDVGAAATPPYAVDLSVNSSAPWGLKVSAAGDLVESSPVSAIDISNLQWKNDADLPGAYQSMVKSPAETVITSGQIPGARSFYFDFRLAVPSLATSGSYSTTLLYTAYTQ